MWDVTHSWARHDPFLREGLCTWFQSVRANSWGLMAFIVMMKRWMCVSFMCETWLIHGWDMTHPYSRYYWFIYVRHNSYVRHQINQWHDSFICVIWLIHMCDMTHSYVWHDSFICVTWLIHMCDMTHSYVRHDSFICEPWLINMCMCSFCVQINAVFVSLYHFRYS